MNARVLRNQLELLLWPGCPDTNTSVYDQQCYTAVLGTLVRTPSIILQYLYHLDISRHERDVLLSLAAKRSGVSTSPADHPHMQATMCGELQTKLIVHAVLSEGQHR